MLKTTIITSAFAFALLTSASTGFTVSPASAANNPDGPITPDVSTRFCPDLGTSKNHPGGPKEDVNIGTKSCQGFDNSGADVTN